MPTVHQQFRHLTQRKVLWNSLHYLACLRYFEPQKLIALTILARPRLEEAHEYLPLLIILQRLHISYNLFRRHHKLIRNLPPKVQKIPEIQMEIRDILLVCVIISVEGRRQPFEPSAYHWPLHEQQGRLR